MKRIILSLIFLISLNITSCGGGGDSVEISGPTLDIGEAVSLVVDQLYINGGMEDEYSDKGEFSVYLRDAATGEDVACTTEDGGMKKLSKAGVYYGGLSIPFVEVESEHPSEMARFQIVFVEKDRGECPKDISDDDDVIGISTELMFEGLVGKTIWASNGEAAVYLRASNEEKKTVKQMAPSISEGLYIDQIYFDVGENNDKDTSYYLFIDEVWDGKSIYQCQLDEEMKTINYGGIVYSALGFNVPCFSATDPDFANIKARFGVYAQRESGTAVIGETEVMSIGDLIGEIAPFTNGVGFISFDGVKTLAFGADVVRLADLASLSVNSVEYKLSPSANSTVELEVTNSDGDLVIACAGKEQGLNMSSASLYDGLDVKLAFADGQKELFGWKDVVVRVVERTDGLNCPKTLSKTPKILAKSGEVPSGSFASGKVEFESAAGAVKFSILSAGQ